jgi:hypothetical protein
MKLDALIGSERLRAHPASTREMQYGSRVAIFRVADQRVTAKPLGSTSHSRLVDASSQEKRHH